MWGALSECLLLLSELVVYSEGKTRFVAHCTICSRLLVCICNPTLQRYSAKSREAVEYNNCVYPKSLPYKGIPTVAVIGRQND